MAQRRPASTVNNTGAVPTDTLHLPAQVVVTAPAVDTSADSPRVLEELSGVSERLMIIRMTTTARPQQRYDHRLRDRVQRTGDVRIATNLGVPRSTARGWLGKAPKVVVSLDVTDLRCQNSSKKSWWASPSTWYHLVRKFGWRRPRLRLHSAKPKVGLRTTRADEMWHIDTTVIRLLDGTRVYLHAVLDNFSRRILAGRVADTCAPVNSVGVVVEASRGATPSATTPVVLADAGVENVNAHVDDLITTGVLRRVLAFTELTFSNSMIEAWWRSLKHQWLFLHSLDNVTTVRRLVAFYVDEHNRVLPHSAFRGQTLDEMYCGTGDAVPADLTSRAAAARRTRVEANRSASCERCPPVDAAA